MSHSLKELILSHNRITSLAYFRDLLDSHIEILDLNDNYIGELKEIQTLNSLKRLDSIIFQFKQGSNPMCDFENYSDAVRMYLPQATKIDGHDVYSKNPKAVSAPVIKPSLKQQENLHPNLAVQTAQRTVTTAATS